MNEYGSKSWVLVIDVERMVRGLVNTYLTICPCISARNPINKIINLQSHKLYT